MNYEILTIILSIVLIAVTYMQYHNNKHNFLNEKLPILNIKKTEGAYIDSELNFMIILENIGDSPAVDIVVKIRINEIEKIKYEKIKYLRENESTLVKFSFTESECNKFIKRLSDNKKLFKKAFKKDEKAREKILLPVLSLNIFYKNIFDKCFSLSYDRGMFQINDIEIGKKRFKGINFISENSITFSLKKIGKRKFNKILKVYNNNLPFIKVDE